MMGIIAKVLIKPVYGITALLVALVSFTFSVWLPNWQLLVQIMPSRLATASEKVSLLWSLYGSLQTNFTIVSASYTIAIAVLFGINTALFVYYIKSRQGKIAGSNSVVGIGGIISGIFGVGCAACGTFILSAVLGLVGGAGIIALLPFGGEEFGILGVVLLGYALYMTIQKIQRPLVCEVTTTK